MTTAGPFPTKPMFEQLKTQVQGAASPWAFQDHFVRDVADATTEGYTSGWPNTLSIIPTLSTPTGLTALGALFIVTPANQQGTVDAVCPQDFPALGEFEVRLGVDQDSPAVQAGLRFLLTGTTSGGAELAVVFSLAQVWTHASAPALWAAPIPLGSWVTVRVELTPEGVTVTRWDGERVSVPFTAGWHVGASPWRVAVEVDASAVPGESAWGAVDVLAWRPLATGPL